MPKKTTAARRPDEYIGERLLLARKGRDWLQADLVRELHRLGFTQWWQSKVAKIERGETKRLALEDLLALAAALGVQPALLLSPADGDVQVAPKLRRSAEDFRAWLRSDKPLRPEDERTYVSGNLVPDDEWRSVTIRGEAARATARGNEGKVG
jgi:transcriptional regulator with XRE-family HTH domain